jgi:hypothetical protein
MAKGGDVLKYNIRLAFPDIPYVRDEVAAAMGKTYDLLIVMEGDRVRFPFWLAVVLLGLTGISWFLHLSGRASRRSEPIPLARVSTPRDQPAGQEAPLTVQPIEE